MHGAEWCPACCRPLERQTGLAAFVCVKGHTLVSTVPRRTLEDVRRERADGRARLRNGEAPPS
jgi:hypothetical protein